MPIGLMLFLLIFIAKCMCGEIQSKLYFKHTTLNYNIYGYPILKTFYKTISSY